MTRFVSAVLLAIAAPPLAAADKPPPKPLVTGLTNPESVAVGPDGRVYVSVVGEFNKDGDGAVMVVAGGKAAPFASGLNDPKGLVGWKDALFVADKDRVLRIDLKGKVSVLADATAFPAPPQFLNDIAVDEGGTLYVSDSGDFKGNGGAVYRVPPKGKVQLVADGKKSPAIKTPNGLAMDGRSHLLVLDFGTGELHRLKLAGGTTEKVADGFGGGDGVAWDYHGRLYVTDHPGGKVYGIARPGEKPVAVASGLTSAADLCLDPTGKFLLVPDMKAGTVTAIPNQVPGFEVDESPLPVETAVAFPDLQWTGWKSENAKGQPVPLRPIVLTHANDGSNRVFVATQQGVVHVFPNDQKATQTNVFLDIEKKVRYNDNTNEEGFLGLAFPPDYKKTGEFYAFYTDRNAKLTNVVSRFRVSKDDPDRADPVSEEEILRVTHRFWNHDGGTIVFGPDGHLYVVLGDGGDANDPDDNGQKMTTLLGKILRIDVTRKDGGKPYAIPADNPFAGRSDVRPEIWCYGVRNPWRVAFDRKTGKLWCGEVGQNLWEEVNLIEKGGNYGWNRRESLHPFGAKGVRENKDMVDPIWEYHHDVGKSITGGHVYRGQLLPELDGLYLYADYVSAKIWGLGYDEAKKRVVANRPIKDRNLPILSFGEDEPGEVYLLTFSPTGKGIYRFVRSGEGKR